MAVKTSDYVIELNKFTEDGLIDGKPINANRKTAIRIDGLTAENAKNLDMEIDSNNNLVITYDSDQKLVVSNYSKLKYIKTDYKKEGKKETYNLYDFITNNSVDNTTNPIKAYNPKNLTALGTNYNDKIDLSESEYVPVGKTNIKKNKGITFDGKHGSDILIGTDYNDVFKGGNGNDEITGGKGNDTITGGTGLNTINYTFDAEQGNDVINLTKGENFVLKIDSLEGIKYEYSSNKKDLIIYKEKVDGKYIESVTLKNFAYKDVTNNATKKTENTSSVILTDGTTEVDLRNDRYLVGSSKILPEKSFTGTWLSEEINAKDLDEKFDKKGNLLPYSSKGITLDGKGGNDKIYGSWYSDTIKGGDGNDEIYGEMGNDIITGGTGENYIGHYFSQGNDVINLTKGENLTIALLDSSLTISKVGFEFVNKNRDLKIYNKENESQYFIIKNFVAKDVTNNGNAKKGIEDTSSVELKIGSVTYDLRNAIYDISGDSEKDYFYQIKTEKNYTGSWLNEEIDASLAALTKKVKVGKKYQTVPKEVTDKGLSLNAGSGNDSIVGSKYSDTIKGGNGNDEITGGTGNDNITGGSGENLIKYKKGEGNDVINLTKGEILTIGLNDVDSIEDVKFEFVNKNKDLRIYADSSNKEEYITIKNFVAKDVTNNSNAKKGIEDTSSVMLEINGETYDLRNAIYDINGDSEKDYFYQIRTEKNYTGSWLNEEIDATGTYLTKKVKVGKKYQTVEKALTDKGLSLNGKDGDDFIVGSKYSDTIKGGNGDDVITGGTGNDKLYGEAGENIFTFATGDGKDTVYSGKGEDTVVFENEKAVNITFEQVKKDLIIHYGNDDAVTLKDYFTLDKKGNITGIESSVQNITIEECKFNFITGKETITGTEEANVIWGSEKEHVITGGKGNDIIFGGEVKNTYIFNLGDGTDIINYKGGNDVIKFTDVEITDITFSDYDLENQTFTMSYGESDKITVKGLSTDRNSVKIEDSTGTQYTIFVGDGDNISSTVQKPNSKENTLFISSTGKDSFEGNTGINVFTNCNKYDSNIGAAQGTNIFFITSEQSANLYAQGKNDKIIFKDLELSDLVYTFPTNSAGKVVITNKNNSKIIELMNFATSNVNPTIVDKNGDTTTVCDELGIILDDVGTSGDDIILSSKKDTEVYGKGGSDYINVSADNITIYTYDKDLKNTTEGSSVIVKTNHNYKYTIYAQSEENIIYNEAYNAHGTYYAYIDQKTSIKETNNQTKSTDSVLNIMNTNDEYDKDGVHSDLSIIFNVDKGYTAASGVGNVGDVYIVDATNLSAWANGNDFKGITIKNNVVETINSSDGYSITSEQIAQLAENVANWLTSDGRDYASVNAVLSSDNEADINALTTFFTQASNWTATV